MKFLDPTNDYAFKRIFGNENKKEILISFLNSVLELPKEKFIKSITILNPAQVPKIEKLKETLLDVRCIDAQNITYIVEMQILKVAALDKRIQYYVSKAYTGQLERGDEYPKLNQVIFLGILDFNFFKKGHYFNRHVILDDTTQEHVFKDLAFYFIELPKFNKKEDELVTIEDKWIYFLKHASEIKSIPEKFSEPEIKDAFKILETVNWTKEELTWYEARDIYVQDQRGVSISAYKDGKIDGYAEGMFEGEELGFAKGEEIGLAKGEEIGLAKGEQKKEKNMVLIMHKNGQSAEQINNITGINLEKINNYLRQ